MQKAVPLWGQPFVLDVKLTPTFYHEGGQRAMTNEELVVLIQNGERDRIPELWAQVERLVKKMAYKMRPIAQSRGVMLDDLMQSGFLSVMSAIRYYDGECAFSTVLINCLKTEFANATGYRTKRARNDPFWNAVALEKPVNDEESDGNTLADFVVDYGATQAFPDSEQGALREALAEELARLTEEQQAVIRLQYWDGYELEHIANIMGKPLKEVQKINKIAMRALRRNHKVLRPFFASEGDYLLSKERREYSAADSTSDALSAALAMLTEEQRTVIMSAYRAAG